MNNKAKGSRREREVRDIHLELGYDVIKAGGSLGIFDLACISKSLRFGIVGMKLPDLKLIQVKSNRIDPSEIDPISIHETIAQKEIWIKKDRKTWQYCIIDESG